MSVPIIKIIYSKGKKHEMIMDKEDEDKIRGYNLNVVQYNKNTTCYAIMSKSIGNYKHESHRVHRIIINCPQGFMVDHINGNGLDNRKVNLRLVTHAQNQQNRRGAQSNSKSGIRGVYKFRNSWRAMIQLNGKVKWSKYFSSKEEAEKAIKKKRKELLPFSEVDKK